MEEHNIVDSEKLTGEQGSKTASSNQMMPLKNLGTYDVPEWALYYLENGEDASLSEKDTSMVDDWVKRFPNGYNMVVDWNDYNELDNHPAFGERNEYALTSHGESPYLATKTYAVTFYDPIEREESYIEAQDKILDNFLPTVTNPKKLSSGDIVTLGEEMETLPDYAPLQKAYDNFYNAEEDFSLYGRDSLTAPDEREEYKAKYIESKDAFYSLLKDTVDDYLERYAEKAIGSEKSAIEKNIVFDKMDEMEQENINYTRVDDFRRDLSFANDLFTEEFPELLNDFTRKTVFSSLLSVHDRESLEAWMAAYQKTDIAHEGPLVTSTGVKMHNLLADLGKQTSRLTPEERELVGRDIAKMVADKFEAYPDRELAILDGQRYRIEKENPDALVLFRKGDGYVAYGNDADRIFEKKGWQISDLETDKRTVSWVEINKDGKDVLSKDFPVVVTDTQAELRDFPLSGKNFLNDNLIADVQQKIEHGRDSLSLDHASIATPGLRFRTHERELYDTAHYIHSLNIDKENISLVEENGKMQPLMSNGAWNVNRENVDAFVSLSHYLQDRNIDVAESVKNYAELKNNQLSLADKVLDEYAARKYSSPNTIFMMHGSTDHFIFGNDAIYAAQELKSPLWQMETSKYRTTPVTVIKEKSYDWVPLAFDEGKDIRGFKGQAIFDRYSLGLEPSPLNEGLKSPLQIEDAGIFKKKNGDYAIRATIDGMEMGIKKISAADARRYLFMPDGLEKDATLKTIASKAYKEDLSKGTGVENKLSSLKY